MLLFLFIILTQFTIKFMSSLFVGGGKLVKGEKILFNSLAASIIIQQALKWHPPQVLLSNLYGSLKVSPKQRTIFLQVFLPQ